MGLRCRRLLCSVCVLALSSVASAAPRIYLHLTFQPDNSLSTSIRAAAIAEAARIWSGYGVAIGADTHLIACDAGTLRLSIVLEHAPSVGKEQERLGTIRFGADGAPDSTIVLYD